MSQSPTKVKIRFVTPRLIDAASALFIPASPSSRGAKYRITLIPET